MIRQNVVDMDRGTSSTYSCTSDRSTLTNSSYTEVGYDNAADIQKVLQQSLKRSEEEKNAAKSDRDDEKIVHDSSILLESRSNGAEEIVPDLHETCNGITKSDMDNLSDAENNDLSSTTEPDPPRKAETSLTPVPFTSENSEHDPPGTAEAMQDVFEDNVPPESIAIRVSGNGFIPIVMRRNTQISASTIPEEPEVFDEDDEIQESTKEVKIEVDFVTSPIGDLPNLAIELTSPSAFDDLRSFMANNSDGADDHTSCDGLSGRAIDDLKSFLQSLKC